MSAACGIDEDDIERLRRGVGDGIFCYIRSVFAIPALVQLYCPQPLPGGEFTEIPSVHPELFDGARTECVTGSDEDGEVVLEEEEGQFGEIGGFSNAVDADDGDNVGTRFGGGEMRRMCDAGYGV